MTTRLPLFTLLLAALAIASCGDDAGPEDSAACVSTSDGALMAAARQHVRNIDVSGDGTPANSEEGQADRVEVDVCRSSDEDGRATVTVLGLRDDSIRDVRHVMVLEKRDGTWVIVRDGDSYRCQQGRGQQDFEPKRCV